MHYKTPKGSIVETVLKLFYISIFLAYIFISYYPHSYYLIYGALHYDCYQYRAKAEHIVYPSLAQYRPSAEHPVYPSLTLHSNTVVF